MMTSLLLAQAEAAAEAGSIAGHFTWIDWAVVIGYLVITTILGGYLAGKQSSVKDFFLGGKKMPWYAVSGSSIATEISAVTFVGAPAIIYGAGGNFTYLQLGLVGVLIARLIVAFILVPAYYKREIYSPYDYMGHRLGDSAKWVTTMLFSLGGVLGQSARVYLTAVILELVMAEQLAQIEAITGIDPIITAIGIIGVVAIGWTIMGGIATVIWTDVMLFIVFVVGGLVALFTIVGRLDGGWEQLITVADEAGKWQLWDFEWDATKEFTIYTAAFASVFGNVGVYGTDQLMAQRIFCCKNQREAKIAVLAAYVGQVITALMLTVGAGLYVFYQQFPLTGEALRRVEEEGDGIFPIFILSELPTGVTGLIIAGIFAAAISSLDSILAALSQTTMSVTYLRWRQKQGHDIEDHGAQAVFISRALVIFWGVVLCLAAYVVKIAQDEFSIPILSLALGLASYSTGSLLAAFLLGFLPLNKTGYGLVFSAPLSVMTIFAVVWHEPWSINTNIAAGVILVAAWVIAALAGQPERRTVRLLKTPIVFAGAFLIWYLAEYGYFMIDGERDTVAWPWWAVIGFFTAFIFGYLLADPKPEDWEEQQAASDKPHANQPDA
ncbi:sodium:solute symporter family transporter [Mucisphaera sp.]|uniref:sodium:solute symporter family transporter n=1 Tax=Mucisphaera sp. TaxID=2913024 RepID=UPI003D109ACA